MYHNIPPEMRQHRQWIVWNSQPLPAQEKFTKIPVNPLTGFPASVTEPSHWAGFDEAVNSVGRVNGGLGFVFTRNDPYSGVDFDDPKGNEEIYTNQLKWFQELNSYTERSPSGTGVHVIVKGKLPGKGKRSQSKAIELYDNERFFCMTGNVLHNAPINERQEVVKELYVHLGGELMQRTQTLAVTDQAQTVEDKEVLETAAAAVNGFKFGELYRGNWQQFYGSQSEADYALIDIIAFYSRNADQIARLFRASELGQRDKAKRNDYVYGMIRKSFDNQIPTIDVSSIAVKGVAFSGGASESSTGQASQSLAPNAVAGSKKPDNNAAATSSHDQETNVNPFPPGLLGEVAQFIYDAAPRQVHQVALAGAIAFLSGICGRAYNISGTGLNQYILLLAQTGVGKDAISDGTSKLIKQVAVGVPAIIDFKGPGELVSSAGIIKWLNRKPCVFSVLGEFGKKMKEMAAPNANAHLHGLSRVLLQMYSKSGHSSVFDPMAYSDSDKNTNPLHAPALTIIGESVPESFYEALDENLIADGLLPRFMVFEFKGQREYLNKGHSSVQPDLGLINKVGDLAATALTIMNRQSVSNVGMTPEAAELFDRFDIWTTDQINGSKTEIHRMLWNRAHLKATKLAALQAVGLNWHNPIIDASTAQWATDLIVYQTNKLVAKFESGQVGQIGGSESRQIGEVIKVITSYFSNPFERFKSYGGTEEMHAIGVITESHISRRLMAVAAFKNDRSGATAAIKRSLKVLLDADDISEMPPHQMKEKFGCKPRAFVISNPVRFAPVVEED